jgi:APA family basic amino acid/polyamine antiporter
VSATALVVANMIGTGVFTTSGFLLKDLGSPWAVLAAWVGGGLLAAAGAVCYGALARRIPESGGEYLFLSRTLHPAAGYIAGWISLLVGFSAPLAAVAYGFGEYARPWLGDFPVKVTGSVVMALFALIHAADVRRGAWLQNWIVAVKLALLFGFVGLALNRLDALPPVTVGSATVPTLAVSLVWVSFSYAGWNAAVYLGGEVRNAERTLPRSMLAGTAIVTVLYLALNAVFVFSTTPDKLAGQLQIGRIAAEALGGLRLANVVTGVILLALVTSVSSLLMAGPRVYATMAKDGYLPRWLAASAGPPRAAITLQFVLALLLLWSATYEMLLTYIGFTLSLSTAATVLGLMRLKAREGEALKVVGWPWLPALFIAAVLAIAVFTIARQPVASLFGLLTMALGWVAWRVSVPRNHRE